MLSRVHPGLLAVGASLLALGGLLGFLYLDQRPADPNPENRPLVVYCAAGMQKPMKAVAAAYEEEFGQRVELQFGGSNTLLANIEVAQVGDLYIPGDDKGKPEANCAVGLAGYHSDDQTPFGRKGTPAIQCTDCDPSRDLDGVAEPNGSCTFSIAVRVNDAGVDGCTPTPLKKVKAKAKTKTATTSKAKGGSKSTTPRKAGGS